MSTFNITAAPDTDIWRKPPSVDVFNAPTASPPGTTSSSSSSSSSSGPLSTFRSAQVTFTSTWTEQYDQAGILLSFRPSSPSSTTTITPPHPSSNPSATSPHRWIKTGIEYYNNQPMLSTVTCAKWADWSISSLPPTPSSTTTIRLERQDGEHDQEKGASIWVYQVLPSSGEKRALREICWVYEDADPDVWTLDVQAMAARPSKTATGGLEVEFRDMVVEWVS